MPRTALVRPLVFWSITTLWLLLLAGAARAETRSFALRCVTLGAVLWLVARATGPRGARVLSTLLVAVALIAVYDGARRVTWTWSGAEESVAWQPARVLLGLGAISGWLLVRRGRHASSREPIRWVWLVVTGIAATAALAAFALRGLAVEVSVDALALAAVLAEVALVVDFSLRAARILGQRGGAGRVGLAVLASGLVAITVGLF